jgi:predicted phage replisome organizer
MSDVKWIKIVTDIFDDDKMLLIESLPSADSIIVIWFKLLCLAGKNNNNGVFMLNDKIAYTDEMMATIFRRDINTVRLALKTFEDFGMIEIIEGVVTIPNWGKHQNLDKIEQKNEYMREYMREYRAKQKEQIECKTNSKSNDVNVRKSNVSEADKIREEKEKEEEIEIDKNNTTIGEAVQDVLDIYALYCPSLPSVKKVTDKRRKAIRNLLKAFTIEEIKDGFQKAEQSDFCKGKGGKGWIADLDFLINPNNLTKVIEGKYDNRISDGGTDSKSVLDTWLNA